MSKLTLDDVASGYSTATKINSNSALIEAAVENTLSRDGTGPNTMSANIDMDTYTLVNIRDATSNQSPVTLAQLNAAGSLTSTSGSTSSYDPTLAVHVSSVTVQGALDEVSDSVNIYYNPASALEVEATTVQDALDELSISSNISYIATGNLIANNVKTAIDELEAEKALIAGNIAQDFSIKYGLTNNGISNSQTISTFTLAADRNMILVGPVTITTGQIVILTTGCVLRIL